MGVWREGGFGSMLRSMGKNLHKTTNFGSMVDLHGRRLRDVQNDSELKEWLNENKKKTHDDVLQIQAEYRAIKTTGRFLEKRMCPHGDDCRYMYKCKFRHPCDIVLEKETARKKLEEERRKRPLKQAFGSDPNNPFANMYEMDVKDAVKAGFRRCIEIQKEDLKKNLNKKNNIENKNNLLKKIQKLKNRIHPCHDHELAYGTRPFTYIECDVCHTYFVGASWNCIDGCDFDICKKCAEEEADFVKNDDDRETEPMEIDEEDEITKNKIANILSPDSNRKKKGKKRKRMELEKENEEMGVKNPTPEEEGHVKKRIA